MLAPLGTQCLCLLGEGCGRRWGQATGTAVPGRGLALGEGGWARRGVRTVWGGVGSSRGSLPRVGRPPPGLAPPAGLHPAAHSWPLSPRSLGIRQGWGHDPGWRDGVPGKEPRAAGATQMGKCWGVPPSRAPSSSPEISRSTRDQGSEHLYLQNQAWRVKWASSPHPRQAQTTPRSRQVMPRLPPLCPEPQSAQPPP